MATAVMSIVIGVAGTLAATVRQGWEYSQNQSDIAQQARVILERINRRVTSAYATVDHPGFGVVTAQAGSYTFPDTLVVWSPTGPPANASGPPLVRECVFFCPDPANPSDFVELSAPGDSRSLPLDSSLNDAAQVNLVESIKVANSTRKVVLSSLLRRASTDLQAAIGVGGTSGGRTSLTNLRGAARFVRTLTPSATAWSQYQAGTRTWSDLGWPQDWQGTNYGTRQAWLRIELQFVEPSSDAITIGSDSQAVGVLGSVALYYQVKP